MPENEAQEWLTKIKKAYDPIVKKTNQWREFRRLWQGRVPDETGTKRSKEFRANTFVNIVRPIVDTFVAKELIQFLGVPSRLTYKVTGKYYRKKMRWLEDRLQKTAEILWNSAYRYENLKGIVTDAYCYGIGAGKIMEPDDDYDVFEIYPIRPWNFLYDQLPVKWKNVGWAGHEKMLSKKRAKEKYGDEVDELPEKPQTLTKPVYRLGKKGIIITEIWDKAEEEVIILGNRQKILTRFSPDPFHFPFIFRRINAETNQPWGQGIIYLLQHQQYYANLMKNMEIDNTMRTAVTRWLVPPGVNTEDLKFVKPGGLIPVRGKQRPEPLEAPNYSEQLTIDVEQKRRNAELTVGLSDIAQGMPVSKRMTKEEFQRLSQNIGGGRFWDIVKEAESGFYMPLMEKVLNFMAEAPKDLFDEYVKPMNAYENAAEYVIAGHLSPQDIKKHRIRVKSTVAQNIASQNEKTQKLFLLLRTIASVDDTRLKPGEAIKRIAEEIDIPGMEDIVKSDAEIQREREGERRKLARRLVNEARIRGTAGGAGTPPPEGV